MIRSFEPGETWFWNYDSNESFTGPRLAAPEAHPLDQAAPGPQSRLPANWQELLSQ